MKKIAFCAASLFSMTAFSQNTFPATGTVGIGTSTPNSGFNAQIHGTTNYTDLTTYYYDWEGVIFATVPGTNQGITSRLGFTSTGTGFTGTDGTILRQGPNDFVIQNLERHKVILQSNRAFLKVDGVTNRVNVGEGTHNLAASASFNVYTPYDNGISVETNRVGMYGLKLKVKSDPDYALSIYGLSPSSESFSIRGSGATTLFYNKTINTDKVLLIKNATRSLLQLTNDGILRSREIIVDAQTWSDYVFEPTYKLRSLDEVKAYIAANGHLPNVPSTAEVTENGVNLAKTDAILLEKIEELTLYILQLKEQNELLEERLKILEASK